MTRGYASSPYSLDVDIGNTSDKKATLDLKKPSLKDVNVKASAFFSNPYFYPGNTYKEKQQFCDFIKPRLKSVFQDLSVKDVLGGEQTLNDVKNRVTKAGVDVMKIEYYYKDIRGSQSLKERCLHNKVIIQ